MSKELQVKQKTLIDFLASKQDEIGKALPSMIKPDRFLRIVFNSMQKNPKLANCTLPSVYDAVMQSAQLGLVIDGVLGHGYLVPYKDKAQFQVGYKGLMALAWRSELIESISANVVRVGDEFEYEFGLNEKLRHVPATDKKRGDITHAWALAKIKGGGHVFVVLPVSEINETRDKTQAYKYAIKDKRTDTPWIEHYPSMCKKTAIKRLAAFLPMATELQAAAAADDLVEFNINPAPDVASKTDKAADDLEERLRNETVVDGEIVDEETGEIQEEKPEPEKKGKGKTSTKKKEEPEETELQKCGGCGQLRPPQMMKDDYCHECLDM